MPTKDPFPRVKEAREALKTRALEILESYLATAAEARAAGKFEESLSALQWLIEHMPKDEVSIIDSSAAKPAPQSKDSLPSGPIINIGFKLGGVGDEPVKALPAVKLINQDPDE